MDLIEALRLRGHQIRRVRRNSARNISRHYYRKNKSRFQRLHERIQELEIELQEQHERHLDELRAVNKRVLDKINSLGDREDVIRERETEILTKLEELTGAIVDIEHSRAVYQATTDLMRRAAGVASGAEDKISRLLLKTKKKR